MAAGSDHFLERGATLQQNNSRAAIRVSYRLTQSLEYYLVPNSKDLREDHSVLRTISICQNRYNVNHVCPGTSDLQAAISTSDRYLVPFPSSTNALPHYQTRI